MNVQSVVAIAIACAAAAWLARRWWKHGFDDEAHGCSGCSVVKPIEQKATGLSHGARPHERPVTREARTE